MPAIRSINFADKVMHIIGTYRLLLRPEILESLRREIKDAVAYLRAVVNPADEVSLKRIINMPKRGVGDGSVGKVDAWATATPAKLTSRYTKRIVFMGCPLKGYGVIF